MIITIICKSFLIFIHFEILDLDQESRMECNFIITPHVTHV